MKIKNSILIVSALILLNACGAKAKSDVDIKAKITNYNNPQVILEKLVKGKVVSLDTATVDPDGNFEFANIVDEKSFYRLNFNNEGYLFFISSPGKTINISLDAKNYRKYTISGSEDADVLHSFNDGLLPYFLKQDSLNEAFKPYQNSPKRDSIVHLFRSIYMNVENKKLEFIKHFLDQHIDNYASMAIVEQLRGDDAYSYYSKIDESLAKKYKGNKTYDAFNQRVKEMSKLSIGSQIPEISLPNPEGKEVKLSSLRGKYVLVDFWASWCKPCRGENPNIVAAYKKYNSKGFTVYGVSLDRAKQDWVNAIAQDHLDWTQVSDLSFWNSPVVSEFGIEGIPFSILIDKQVKIIAKNLRGGVLDRKLAEIFN